MAQVVDWCQNKDVDLVAIGPEVPLVAGLADELRSAKIRYNATCSCLLHNHIPGVMTSCLDVKQGQ